MGSEKQHINREVSWLSFNERVLQEAADPTVPLIERLKFLGIFSSNLDEFFRVRVGTLQRVLRAKIKAKAVLGSSPKKILNEIHAIVLRQRKRFDKVFAQLYKELEKEKIFIINETQMDERQMEFVRDYFKEEVRPFLVPIMLDSVQQFPYLKNQAIYLAIYLSKSGDLKDVKYALIELPADVLPRFIVLPRIDDMKFIIMLDDVIRYGLKDIFSIFDYDRFDAYTIKLTRDAELDIEDDITQSLLEKISKSVKRRVMGTPVRFVYDREIPGDLLEFILEKINLKTFDNLISGGRYHNARDFIKFPNVGTKMLENKPARPIPHPAFGRSSLFAAIREKDVLLHFPYQSFQYTVDLLREAAIDPKVKSISMTLYRVAKNSNVINALIMAIRNGKSVTALLELQARFDEEANIYWTQRLEEEDAHLIQGVSGLKVHAKLCLITREENGKLVRYAIIGTGNFNEETAEIYSDHSLLTCNKHITREVEKVFDFLANNYKTYNYNHLVVSPFYMRKHFIKLIKNEIKNAQSGKKSYIYAKMNSLVDPQMVDKLYEASVAGVKIRMIIRGICSLVPGVKGLSENIEVTSIVDKYLEHSRIFIFCNNDEPLFFISSADWMVRNLDNRVEVATPIYDKSVQKELTRFMEIQFADNTKSRIINENQDNQYKKTGEERIGRAQDDIHSYLKNA
jgi:polyphosphate kinase